jgi:hypothetical protein
VFRGRPEAEPDLECEHRPGMKRAWKYVSVTTSHYPTCEDCLDDYPKACPKPGCSGVVHAELADEYEDGDYSLHVKCDRCGGP